MYVDCYALYAIIMVLYIMVVDVLGGEERMALENRKIGRAKSMPSV